MANVEYDWNAHLPRMLELYRQNLSIPKIHEIIQNEAEGFTPRLRAVYKKFNSEGYPTDSKERAELLNHLNIALWKSTADPRIYRNRVEIEYANSGRRGHSYHDLNPSPRRSNHESGYKSASEYEEMVDEASVYKDDVESYTSGKSGDEVQIKSPQTELLDKISEDALPLSTASITTLPNQPHHQQTPSQIHNPSQKTATPTSTSSSFRPSKYSWVASTDWQEQNSNFQVSIFKNSYYNRAHYKNPKFQPEEWHPDVEGGSSRGNPLLAEALKEQHERHGTHNDLKSSSGDASLYEELSTTQNTDGVDVGYQSDALSNGTEKVIRILQNTEAVTSSDNDIATLKSINPPEALEDTSARVFPVDHDTGIVYRRVTISVEGTAFLSNTEEVKRNLESEFNVSFYIRRLRGGGKDIQITGLPADVEQAKESVLKLIKIEGIKKILDSLTTHSTTASNSHQIIKNKEDNEEGNISAGEQPKNSRDEVHDDDTANRFTGRAKIDNGRSPIGTADGENFPINSAVARYIAHTQAQSRARQESQQNVLRQLGQQNMTSQDQSMRRGTASNGIPLDPRVNHAPHGLTSELENKEGAQPNDQSQRASIDKESQFPRVVPLSETEQESEHRELHSRLQSELNPYACPFPVCDRRYSRVDVLNTHLLEVHHAGDNLRYLEKFERRASDTKAEEVHLEKSSCEGAKEIPRKSNNLEVASNQHQGQGNSPKYENGWWSSQEKEKLLSMAKWQEERPYNWVLISQSMRTRSPGQCQAMWMAIRNFNLINPEEEKMVQQLVKEMGQQWAEISRKVGKSETAVESWWTAKAMQRETIIEQNLPDTKIESISREYESAFLQEELQDYNSEGIQSVVKSTTNLPTIEDTSQNESISDLQEARYSVYGDRVFSPADYGELSSPSAFLSEQDFNRNQRGLGQEKGYLTHTASETLNAGLRVSPNSGKAFVVKPILFPQSENTNAFGTEETRFDDCQRCAGTGLNSIVDVRRAGEPRNRSTTNPKKQNLKCPARDGNGKIYIGATNYPSKPDLNYYWSNYLPQMIDLYKSGMSIPQIHDTIQNEAEDFHPKLDDVYKKLQCEGYPTDPAEREELLERLNDPVWPAGAPFDRDVDINLGVLFSQAKREHQQIGSEDSLIEDTVPLPIGAQDMDDDYASDMSDSRSVASVADSIFSSLSMITGSSMSSVAVALGATDRLVRLLLEDSIINPLCREAIMIISRPRFERNLMRLLKGFAAELKKEALTEHEKKAVHFVRFRARNSAHLLCNTLNDESSNMKPRLDEPSSAREIEEIAIEDSDEEVDAEEDSESGSSEEVVDNLQPLEAFIKTSQAFEILRTNLRAFINPFKSQASQPKEMIVKDEPEVDWHDESDEMKEISQIEVQPETMVKTHEESLSACQTTSMALAESRVDLWKQKIFEISILIMNLSTWRLQPPIPEGKGRIEWRCKCGHNLYDDFIELQPGALERLKQTLDNSSNSSTLGKTSSFDTVGRTLSGGLQSLRSLLSMGSEKKVETGLPTHERQNYPNFQLDTNDPCPENPALQSEDLLYLLLCYNSSRFATRLLQINLSALGPKNDQALFKNLRREYNSMRGFWTSYLSLRTLQSIKFVHFELFKSSLVDVRQKDVIPPPEHVEYRYLPAPPEVIPPIGTNYLMHLFQNPEHADEDTVCLDRFPKKLKEKLECRKGQVTNFGWGLQFVEGWNMKIIWLVSWVLFGIGSLMVGVLWAIYGHDVQNAFDIAAYIVAFSTISVGALQSLLVM